jgi:hypothetical protein
MPRRSGRSGRTGEPRDFPHVGWREWLALPDLGVAAVKAKIDTGARSSAIHAFGVKVYNSSDGRTMVRFTLHPIQRKTEATVAAEAELLEYRYVTSSDGQRTKRPVIVTHARLLGRTWPIELTLANRDTMGFRMLLGREAVRDRFLIDPGRSYLGGQPPRAGARSQGSGVRGQKSEVRCQKSEVRKRKRPKRESEPPQTSDEREE